MNQSKFLSERQICGISELLFSCLRDVLEFVNVLNVTELFTCYILNSIKTTFNFVHTRARFFLIFTESPSLRNDVDVLFSDGGVGTAG